MHIERILALLNVGLELGTVLHFIEFVLKIQVLLNSLLPIVVIELPENDEGDEEKDLRPVTVNHLPEEGPVLREEVVFRTNVIVRLFVLVPSIVVESILALLVIDAILPVFQLPIQVVDFPSGRIFEDLVGLHDHLELVRLRSLHIWVQHLHLVFEGQLYFFDRGILLDSEHFVVVVSKETRPFPEKLDLPLLDEFIHDYWANNN